MKKGILYAVLASVLWAVVNPFIKQGLSYGFTPMNFAGLRFVTVGIILFAYTWHSGMGREIVRNCRLFGNLILINMFLGYTAFYFGVDFVSGAIGSIVMGLTPPCTSSNRDKGNPPNQWLGFVPVSVSSGPSLA